MTNTTKKKISAQAVFNASASHMLAQGKQSYSSRAGMCAYRGDDGAKCAVGCLIADDEYSDRMEGLAAADVAEEGLLPERLTPHVKLLTALQNAHDAACMDGTGDGRKVFMGEIALELRTVAVRFRLSTAAIAKFGL